MRGALGTPLTIQRDINYDLAKIHKSLMGYDFVLLNKFHLISSSTVQTYLSQLIQTFQHFISTKYSNLINFNDIQVITAHLYFSLIPLHEDFQHQIQFYELAAKLYYRIVLNEYYISIKKYGNDNVIKGFVCLYQSLFTYKLSELINRVSLSSSDAQIGHSSQLKDSIFISPHHFFQ
ncbi:unnamed protein product [Adineta steineri]|uniref:Uncharacterized protein n=1 Tax=Adineta steineri TaxID=433720 RepID=A0A819F3M4_9BILA|nr:unnamed protein product [Adineta steineri]CAF3862039.1 unnamed protein product [Adineta steineri]